MLAFVFLLLLLGPVAAGEGPVLYAVPEPGVGEAQSPINILSAESERHRHRLLLDGVPRGGRASAAPHTLRVDAAEGVTVRLDDRAYTLLQCHYHTPSEHLVDGVTFPAEKHCVSRDAASGDHLVVATLYRMGDPDPLLGAALDAADAGAEVVGIPLISGTTVRSHHYIYHGSLTTPPFSENVSWVVSAKVEEASEEQVARLNALEGNNARHVQKRAGRRVEID